MTADPGSDVAVLNPTLSDFPSNPPAGADPGPTNTGMVLSPYVRSEYELPLDILTVAPAPTVCTYISPTTEDPGSDVPVGIPTLSDFISRPPSDADPDPTKNGISQPPAT
jgi:hypothetical protein